MYVFAMSHDSKHNHHKRSDYNEIDLSTIVQSYFLVYHLVLQNNLAQKSLFMKLNLSIIANFLMPS